MHCLRQSIVNAGLWYLHRWRHEDTTVLYCAVSRRTYWRYRNLVLSHGPFVRYVKLRGACAGDAGNLSPPLGVSDLDMHQGTCVTHMPRCMPGSLLTSGFLWSRWRVKMRNPRFYVSGKRPREWLESVFPLPRSSASIRMMCGRPFGVALVVELPGPAASGELPEGLEGPEPPASGELTEGSEILLAEKNNG